MQFTNTCTDEHRFIILEVLSLFPSPPAKHISSTLSNNSWNFIWSIIIIIRNNDHNRIVHGIATIPYIYTICGVMELFVSLWEKEENYILKSNYARPGQSDNEIWSTRGPFSVINTVPSRQERKPHQRQWQQQHQQQQQSQQHQQENHLCNNNNVVRHIRIVWHRILLELNWIEVR